jgi:hypothetical protein
MIKLVGHFASKYARILLLILLTSNIVGLFHLVNMNQIQLDYTIMPTLKEKQRHIHIFIDEKEISVHCICLNNDSITQDEFVRN